MRLRFLRKIYIDQRRIVNEKMEVKYDRNNREQEGKCKKNLKNMT